MKITKMETIAQLAVVGLGLAVGGCSTASSTGGEQPLGASVLAVKNAQIAYPNRTISRRPVAEIDGVAASTIVTTYRESFVPTRDDDSNANITLE